MKDYPNLRIKEIISRLPNIGHLLEEYGIDCSIYKVGISGIEGVIHNQKFQQELFRKF